MLPERQIEIPHKKKIASLIDHTLLKQNASSRQVEDFCRQAAKYPFATVCINPCHVKIALEELKGSDIKVCTVAGFPLGASADGVKAFEAGKATDDGAQEVDMVINIGALKDGNYVYVEKDIKSVVQAVKGLIVKVIIETQFLNEQEKEMACKIAQNAGAHFVKTSTGMFGGGATVEDVALLRSVVGTGMGVKAAGGVRTLKDILMMVEAGANRIGTSSAITIMQELGK
ncbi:MAG TPA: deoxyribose-phosphate aldolase [Clostridiales bacterium]|nr:deoxyribose-phosphate aldolase [Clostridiales bacterium]